MHNYAAPLRAGAYVRAALGGFRKRAFDIIISSIALTLLAPILLAAAGLIRFLISKSVFVTDEWIGVSGQAFVPYQFRSTIRNCEEESSLQFSLNDHSWAESLGGALRASGLDRLPLLFNVLRGDMSLLGPRPIMANEVIRYRKVMPEYFAARPGLTVLWRRSRALNHRRPITQTALDRYYIRCWSMWLDLGLLFREISASAFPGLPSTSRDLRGDCPAARRVLAPDNSNPTR
jgi:exopolysaccharide production protein ExoY